MLAPATLPFPSSTGGDPSALGPPRAAVAAGYRFSGPLRDPRSVWNLNSAPSSRVEGVERGERRRCSKRSLSLSCTPPLADSTLQGGPTLPGLRPPTLQPGRFGLASGGLSTPSRIIPWTFGSICAARVHDSVPEMFIPLGTAPPHQSAAIELTRKPRGPGSSQEGEARTPLPGVHAPLPRSRPRSKGGGVLGLSS